MSSGGGSQTTVQETKIPKFVEDAAKANLARADYVGRLGYVPYTGPDVAALSAPQTAAIQSTGQGMRALGLAGADYNPMSGVPQPQTFMGGLQGYSSMPIFQQAVDTLKEVRPGQYDAITGMFIDPQSGESSVMFTPQGSVAAQGAPVGVQQAVDYSDPDSGVSGASGTYYDFISSAPVELLSREFGNPSTGQKIVSPLFSALGSLARKKVTDYYNPVKDVSYSPVIPVSAGGSYDDYDQFYQSDSGSSDFSNSSYNAGGGVSTSGGNLGGGYVHGGW